MQLFLNGQSIEIERNDLISLLDQQGIDHTRSGIAIAVNGDVIPRKRWSEHVLEANDQVEVITAMQGG